MSVYLNYIIITLLVIQAIAGVVFQTIYFHIPFWIKYGEIPNIFNLTETINRLLNLFSYVLTFIGLIQLIKLKAIKLVNIFKFPIYFFVSGQMFWFITTLLSKKHSFFLLQENVPWHFYIFKIMNLTLLLAILLYYVSKQDSPIEGKQKIVTKTARFLNWGIDLFIILLFGLLNIRTLSDGFIFDDVPFFNSSPNIFFFINLFWYYLIFELLFLQTIGKLHNNAFVSYKGSRFKSILIRTLCRFIPFDVFSFLGKLGWHDALSKTQVIITQNIQHERTENKN